MHEMGIAQQVIHIALAALPPECAGAKVEVLNLRIGRLTAVVPESLRFCFDIASQGTPLAGARLAIEEVPIEVLCKECRVKSRIDTAKFVCGQCGSGDLQILSGRELIISSLEVAETSDSPP